MIGGRRFELVAVERVGIRTDAPGRCQRRERGHLVVVEGEVEDVEVRADAFAVGRLRDDREAELKVPAQHDLRGRARVRTGDRRDRLLLQETLTAPERAPRLSDDPALVVEPAQLLLSETGMQLDL